MKSIHFLIFACLFYSACRQTTKSPPLACDGLEPALDSLQIREFNRHMTVRGVPLHDSTHLDTVYRFRASEGWGAFDYLCSIYADSSKYWVETIAVLNPNLNNDCQFYYHKKILSRLEWDDLQEKVEKSGFWCANPKFNANCFDCMDYKLWAKEGTHTKIISWDQIQNQYLEYPIRLLACQIQSTCGYFEPQPKGEYFIKGDSVFVELYDRCGLYFPMTSAIEIQGSTLHQSRQDGVYHMSLHKRDLDLLEQIYYVYERLDGSGGRIRVMDIQKADAKINNSR